MYRTILEIQPWDEDAHQHLMHTLAADGEYSAALVQYAACRRAMHDLGIEPGRTTNTLYQRIKQKAAAGTAGAMRAAVTVSAIDELAIAPFVAHERQMDRLALALERVLAGQGQALLITGEAGSGKTAPPGSQPALAPGGVPAR